MQLARLDKFSIEKQYLHYASFRDQLLDAVSRLIRMLLRKKESRRDSP